MLLFIRRRYAIIGRTSIFLIHGQRKISCSTVGNVNTMIMNQFQTLDLYNKRESRPIGCYITKKSQSLWKVSLLPAFLRNFNSLKPSGDSRCKHSAAAQVAMLLKVSRVFLVSTQSKARHVTIHKLKSVSEKHQMHRNVDFHLVEWETLHAEKSAFILKLRVTQSTLF
jgi:hypothetical protein